MSYKKLIGDYKSISPAATLLWTRPWCGAAAQKQVQVLKLLQPHVNDPVNHPERASADETASLISQAHLENHQAV